MPRRTVSTRTGRGDSCHAQRQPENRLCRQCLAPRRPRAKLTKRTMPSVVNLMPHFPAAPGIGGGAAILAGMTGEHARLRIIPRSSPSGDGGKARAASPETHRPWRMPGYARTTGMPGADGGTRTRTAWGKRILSPLRLPISPRPRQGLGGGPGRARQAGIGTRRTGGPYRPIAAGQSTLRRTRISLPGLK